MLETHCGDSYKQYCSDVKTKQEVMEKLHIVKENIQMLEEMYLSFTNEELADGYTSVIEDICLDISDMKTREKELVSSYCNIRYIQYNINMNTHVLDIAEDSWQKA